MSPGHKVELRAEEVQPQPEQMRLEDPHPDHSG